MEGVRELYVESKSFKDPWTLSKLLRSISELVNLSCYQSTLDMGDLAQLQHLRRLKLDHSAIVSPASASLPCIPQLRHMSVEGSNIVSPSTRFLTTAFLPELRHLETAHPTQLAQFAPLIPRLQSIAFGSSFEDPAPLSAATSLLLLSLPRQPVAHRDLLSKLPSLPPFLHINTALSPTRPSLGVHDELIPALKDLLETKKSGLRVIFLCIEEVDATLISVVQQLEDRGIRVERGGGDMDFANAIVRMEEILAKEKRLIEKASQGNW